MAVSTLLLIGSSPHVGAPSPAPSTESASAPAQRKPLVLEPIPLRADSARGDSAAFASLPSPVREVLDIRRQLQPVGGAAGITCVPLSRTSDGSRRQRLQGRLADHLALVVFVRARRDGTIARVEFVRRRPSGGQVGYTWDADGDTTTGMEWAPGSTQASTHPVPRGGPIPRALRGLGRIVLTWRCVES